MIRRRLAGPVRGRPLLAAALAAGLSSVSASPAGGQIVNTLRGWDDPEPGWTGEIEGRFLVASGNSEYLELTAGGAVQLVAGPHRLRLLSGATIRRANDEDVARSFLAHARHNYRLGAVVHTLLFIQHTYDPFRRIKRRSLVGAGTRLDVARAESWDASIGISYMVEGEQLTDDPEEAHEVEGRASLFLTMLGDATDHLELDVSAFFQPLLGDFADARAYVDADTRIDIIGGLDLVVGLGLQHDSRPPEGVDPTDIRLSTGLAFEF